MIPNFRKSAGLRLLAGALVLTLSACAQMPGQADAERARSGVFSGTIAEMTWPEVAQAAKDGAVLLWAFGVIEQHGPHLPTGTDVYVPSARLREVRKILEEKGIRALIVPPYYWGVNVVSGSFPASYDVKPPTMIAVMQDVFASMSKEGFKHVFLVSGHGDALHNKTIFEGARAGIQGTGLDISFVTTEVLAKRLGIDPADRAITLQAPDGGAPGKFVDVHAGDPETSTMMAAYPWLVRESVRRDLKSTDYGPADLAEWRKGYENAKRKTPLGYFGDPAAADAARGAAALTASAQAIADAIERRLKSGR
ncbi:MAG: creatininase family protein [Pigmentiphaga sp.]|uniref:creatininase family protein n=1 Tax=Pigmentiphaga sp. TaxID=1977564 RepID=UPI0029AEB964|nr:creatininase family protein [Pigmentiphaga sp.]MDX3904643.1 creatininase family protein [Pigmentiphaga sp.]